jgi:hypothetical protein
MEVGMTEAAVEMMAQVQDTFEKLKLADQDAREKAYLSLMERHGWEAGAKLRELFEAFEAEKKFLNAAQPQAEKKADPNLAEKPKPLEKKAAITEKRVAQIAKRALVRRYDWDEVMVPASASEIEALTYVPGLVGQVTDWIVRGAIRPNRVMALGVALTVIGTLIGRRFEGPRGNATHLYVFILAPTGWGKDHPLWCGNKIMIEVGQRGLLGPSEFVSGRGIIKYLKRQPLTLCIVDELGELFMMINSQGTNPFVRDILGDFKKLYNSWGLINTAESVRDESVTINHPALSIIGACTPQAFFEALTPVDVEGGFANRAMLLPFEGIRRPPERDVLPGADELPQRLLEELKELAPPSFDLDKLKVSDITEGNVPPVERKDRTIIGWEDGAAKEAYFTFSKEIDGLEETDKRKFELGMRATENAVRCATNVAAGCFSKTVSLRDIGWALRWARVSLEAGYGGISKYMREYYEFPKFCERVEEFIRDAGGFASDRDIARKFRANMGRGFELDKVTKQLEREGAIRQGNRPSPSGPSARGWWIVKGGKV